MKQHRFGWMVWLASLALLSWGTVSLTLAQQQDEPRSQRDTGARQAGDQENPPGQQDDQEDGDARSEAQTEGDRQPQDRDRQRRSGDDRRRGARDDRPTDGNGDERGRWETGISFETDPDERLIVSELDDDAVLARSGLRRGDVILSVNGREVASREDFLRWIHVSRPDRPIAIVVWRDGNEQEVFVDVFRNDGRDSDVETDFSEDARATLGVVLDLRWDNAAVVDLVQPGSPADEAGVRAGDQIVQFNGRRVTSPLHLVELVARQRPGDTVEIEVVRRVTRAFDVVLDARDFGGDQRYAEQPRDPRRRLGEERRDDDDFEFDEPELEIEDELDFDD